MLSPYWPPPSGYILRMMGHRHIGWLWKVEDTSSKHAQTTNCTIHLNLFDCFSFGRPRVIMLLLKKLEVAFWIGDLLFLCLSMSSYLNMHIFHCFSSWKCISHSFIHEMFSHWFTSFYLSSCGFPNGKRDKYLKQIPDGIVLQPHQNLNQVFSHTHTHTHYTILYLTALIFALQISQMTSDATYMLPDLLQKISSASPSYNALSTQQQAREENYTQSPTALRSPTHQELPVSISSVTSNRTQKSIVRTEFYINLECGLETSIRANFFTVDCCDMFAINGMHNPLCFASMF